MTPERVIELANDAGFTLVKNDNLNLYAITCYMENLQRFAELVMQEQSRWLPIKSAPKDGTSILTWSPNEGRARENYVMQESSYRGFWAKSNAPSQPTHWQPIPAPPTTSQEG